MADNNLVNQHAVQNQQFQQPQQFNYNQQTFNNPYYQNNGVNPYAGYQQWGNYQVSAPTQAQSPQQIQYPQPNQQLQNSTEYILLDGSAPNKKRKYIFVGEVDIQTNVVQPLPSFTLEDVRNVVAREFDARFGEEKKK